MSRFLMKRLDSHGDDYKSVEFYQGQAIVSMKIWTFSKFLFLFDSLLKTIFQYFVQVFGIKGSCFCKDCIVDKVYDKSKTQKCQKLFVFKKCLNNF